MWWGRRPAEGKPAAPTMPSTLPSPLSPLRLGVAEGRVGLGRGGLATTCLWGGHCANSLGPVVWEAAPRGQSAVPVLRPLRTSPLPGPGSPPRSPPTEVGGEAEGRVPLWFCGLASAGGANPQRGGGTPPAHPSWGPAGRRTVERAGLSGSLLSGRRLVLRQVAMELCGQGWDVQEWASSATTSCHHRGGAPEQPCWSASTRCVSAPGRTRCSRSPQGPAAPDPEAPAFSRAPPTGERRPATEKLPSLCPGLSDRRPTSPVAVSQRG